MANRVIEVLPAIATAIADAEDAGGSSAVKETLALSEIHSKVELSDFTDPEVIKLTLQLIVAVTNLIVKKNPLILVEITRLAAQILEKVLD